eukprot:4978272-Amphidinium_carterae.2
MSVDKIPAIISLRILPNSFSNMLQHHMTCAHACGIESVKLAKDCRCVLPKPLTHATNTTANATRNIK